MRTTKLSGALATASTMALVAGLGLSGGAAAADPPGSTPPGHAKRDDVRHVGPDYNNGKSLPIDQRSVAKAAKKARKDKPPKFTKVGDTKAWAALDDTGATTPSIGAGIYFKEYTLRGVGKNIQVWVADDRKFPEGDCRNGLGLTEITDGQVKSFIHEFDRNIYPVESAAFSVPPERDGSSSAASGYGFPADYWQVRKQRADDIVVLVDNVRDANYYAPETDSGQTYIAGFHYSTFNELHDRNIMTIDAYDWLHRTGANPPDDSEDPAYLSCAAASGAPRPLLYEGTFAHEYQHLLEYYEDAGEATWVNEGLSDFAQTLVGYVDPSVPVTDPSADSHIACFAGYLEESFGGPENSLTRWGEQGGPETLCDYGATYSFMQYLFDHYGGLDLMSALHRDDANGLDGVASALQAVGHGDVDVMQVVRDWAAMAALDEVIDGGATLTGGDPATYSSDTLGMSINWANPEAYTEAYDGSDVVADAYAEGAPTNGSDYVRLRDAAGQYLSAAGIESISFDGAESYPTQPVEWAVDQTPPDSLPAGDDTCGTAADGAADPALYSGCGPDLDRSIARSVTVPTENPTLRFDTIFDTEEGFDYGFVQVSTDGGDTWTSIEGNLTTPTADGDALPNIPAGEPALQGDSGGPVEASFDLSQYAGQEILLGFRYVTDPGVHDDGWWVDDVTVGGALVSDGSALDGWQTYSQLSPLPVENWTVQLVAYDDAGTAAWMGELPLGKDFAGEISGAELDALIGTSAETVAAIVMAEDRSETVEKNATYLLTVDGVLQPGGGSAS